MTKNFSSPGQPQPNPSIPRGPEENLRLAQDYHRAGRLASAQSAFTEFTKQTQSQLLERGSKQPVPPGHEVHDVVQTVYAKVWRNLWSYDPKQPVMPWLYTVMKNVATDLYRQQARRPLMRSLEASGFDHSLKLPAQADWDVLDLPIHLSRLTASERDAVECRYLKGLSIAETAQALGIRPGTVGGKVHRALAKMRTFL